MIGSVLRLRETDEDDRRILFLSGDLDLAVADEFLDQVSSLAASVAPRDLVLDLSELEFIDSRGIAALAVSELHAQVSGGASLFIRRPTPLVERVLTITAVIDQLPMLGE